ncbi:MAG: hypothetical protein OIN86_00690 [Candidatus Methanoperedens sp.]|nr:hypothetical protein [Candidatus Methanoperedens sp.]CAG0965414.1 hypothetical protein METP1_00945 [Methanosarcinales archaeon]
MDCCKPKETDKEIKKEQTGTEQDPAENEHKQGGGCCGGGGTKDMLLHIVLMVVVVLVVSYFTRG